MVREYLTMEIEKGDGVAVIRMAPRASDFHGRANPVDELGTFSAACETTTRSGWSC